jgi:hypothetical protein
METHSLLVDGVVFDPVKRAVAIHDSHGRLFTTLLVTALGARPDRSGVGVVEER